MKASFISDLRVGDELINEPFLLRDVGRRTTKDDRPFLICTATDKTGEAGGVFWNVPDYIEEWIRPGLVVLVTGRVVSYKEALQINITDLNLAPESDMRDFLPASKRTQEEMIAELRTKIARLNEPWQTLVSTLLLEQTFLEQFVMAPAARTMHHAYIGGLLEHSLSMATLAETMVAHYDYVNKDLLISGALLHDMGKVIEYDTEGGISFSEDGRLVGHIIRAIVQVETAAAKLENFPQNKLRDLIHLIASHHGKLEWGAPVVPKTLEAILLHQLDLLDSRVQGYIDHVSNDPTNKGWTVKSSYMFNTELRHPDYRQRKAAD